jgi:hypothetical protein
MNIIIFIIEKILIILNIFKKSKLLMINCLIIIFNIIMKVPKNYLLIL